MSRNYYGNRERKGSRGPREDLPEFLQDREAGELARVGATWSDSERDALITGYKNNPSDLRTLAQRHQRSVFGVIKQLEYLKVVYQKGYDWYDSVERRKIVSERTMMKATYNEEQRRYEAYEEVHEIQMSEDDQWQYLHAYRVLQSIAKKYGLSISLTEA
jgi:hypothetical protein